jgi:3-deoxy-D-manno-octulosonic acid kinase
MAEARPEADVRREYGVPDAVRLRLHEGALLAFSEGFEDAVARVAARPDVLGGGTLGLAGRGPVAVVPTPHGALVVREYRKGGMLRGVRGRLFRGRFRPLDELVLLRRCAGARVPVPEAVGAVVLGARSGWRGFLLTREVEGAVDLESVLYERGAAGREVLRAAGRAVRSLHDAGVRHADLHPKNLLVDGADRVVVIDLDRARAFDGPLPHEHRLSNLERLGRAVEKHRLRGMPVSRRHALRFLEGYAGGADAAARWLEEVRARLRVGLPLRTLWWRVTGQTKPRGRPAPGRAKAGDAA